jgi:hypothetical protein
MQNDSLETLLLRHYGSGAQAPIGLEEKLYASVRAENGTGQTADGGYPTERTACEPPLCCPPGSYWYRRNRWVEPRHGGFADD